MIGVFWCILMAAVCLYLGSILGCIACIFLAVLGIIVSEFI